MNMPAPPLAVTNPEADTAVEPFPELLTKIPDCAAVTVSPAVTDTLPLPLFKATIASCVPATDDTVIVIPPLPALNT